MGETYSALREVRDGLDGGKASGSEEEKTGLHPDGGGAVLLGLFVGIENEC